MIYHRTARHAVSAIALLLVLASIRGAWAASPQEEFKKIHWTTGPATVTLGTVATLNLPKGYRFADSTGAEIWNRLTQNPSGGELGIVVPPAGSNSEWFMTFKFNDMGYVKDNETLDSSTADGILKTIRDATDKSNERRRQNGWETLSVVGWDKAPFYDPATHHLTWAIRGRSSSGSESVNYDSRVLGRHGVLQVKLVADPAQVTGTVPTYNMLVGNITFNKGESYAEYRSGDKVAQYGLVGLITGGAAVAAVKFWPKLLKLGAVAVAGVLGLFAKIKNMFTRKKA